jgi:hypothetical protein
MALEGLSGGFYRRLTDRLLLALDAYLLMGAKPSRPFCYQEDK